MEFISVESDSADGQSAAGHDDGPAHARTDVWLPSYRSEPSRERLHEADAEGEQEGRGAEAQQGRRERQRQGERVLDEADQVNNHVFPEAKSITEGFLLNLFFKKELLVKMRALDGLISFVF